MKRQFAILLLLGTAAVSPPALAQLSTSEVALRGHRALLEARTLYANQDWEAAVEAYSPVLESNPYDGLAWFEHGFALHNLQRYEEAIVSFRHSHALGVVPATNLYNIACGQALLGRKDEALATLERVMTTELAGNRGLLLTDTDLDSLRDDPRFMHIVGLQAPDGLSRDDGWAHDFDILERRLKTLHYDVDAVTPFDEIERAIEAMRSRIADTTNVQLAVGVRRVLAMVGDGHTRVSSSPFPAGYMPIRMHIFSDGMFVTAADPKYEHLIGLEVLSIGDLRTADAIEAVAPYISRDNEMGLLSGAPAALRQFPILRALGLADDEVEVVFLDENGRELTGRLEQVKSRGRFWVQTSDRSDAPLPLYLRRRNDTYWFEHLPEHDLVYFQQNQIRSDPSDPYPQFIERLFAFIEDNSVGHLVIDLRFNGGGNTGFNRHLLRALVRSDRINNDDRLFVITSRRTFSAAMNLTTDLEQHTHAVFVGEPAGSRPNFIGETTIIRLPYTGLTFSCSTRMHQHGADSSDQRTLIAPDIYVVPTSDDYANNRDPVLETILALIRD